MIGRRGTRPHFVNFSALLATLPPLIIFHLETRDELVQEIQLTLEHAQIHAQTHTHTHTYTHTHTHTHTQNTYNTMRTTHTRAHTT